LPRLVAAPDKFRGTATAHEVAEAIVRAATSRGWTAAAAPMSDGGEGFVEVLGGDVRTAVVRGPLGAPVHARWSMLEDLTAIIESAEAAGRALLAAPVGDQPLSASTYGVGELVATAQRAGAARIVVGVGGTASTDGGRGCVEALEDRGVTIHVPLVAACDVLVAFDEAPSRFGPQKGASAEQVGVLERRLAVTAEWYRERFGVDVTAIDGAGAGGGLAGGLIALGATAVSGARFVAEAIDLIGAARDADLVVTGEGALDAGTLEGKVVRTVLDVCGAVAALVLAGRVDDDAGRSLGGARDGLTRVVVLTDGQPGHTAAAIERAVAAYLDEPTTLSSTTR
jgi:glycerate kinase